MNVDPALLTALELAQSRRDTAFLSGDLATLSVAQDELIAAWAAIPQHGRHFLLVEDEDLDLEHVQCPRIESKSLDGYHGPVTYLCPVEHLLNEVGMDQFFTADPNRDLSGSDAVFVSEGRHEVEWVPAESDRDEPWLLLKEQP